MYATGLRVSELCALPLSAIHEDQGIIVVRHGKGNKQRTVPIGEFALGYLRDYLMQVRPLFAKKADKSRARPPHPRKAAPRHIFPRREKIRRHGGIDKTSLSHPPPLLRDPPPRRRRRVAYRPGNAWSQASFHNGDLHPRLGKKNHVRVCKIRESKMKKGYNGNAYE